MLLGRMAVSHRLRRYTHHLPTILTTHHIMHHIIIVILTLDHMIGSTGPATPPLPSAACYKESSDEIAVALRTVLLTHIDMAIAVVPPPLRLTLLMMTVTHPPSCSRLGKHIVLSE